jgi:CubicO group peptidase (beta-lactamase class C family)
MSSVDLINDWPVENAAAGWLGPNRAVSRAGASAFGFALASVTKPLFAFTVLIAVEEGTLSLDQPAGPPGSTIRHLLAHASGLDPDRPEAIAEVATRRIYSNAGFELLGRELEKASGLPAETYFHEALVEPLGLSSTMLVGSPAFGAMSSVDDLLVLIAEFLQPTLISPLTMNEATTPQFPDLDGVLPGFGHQSPNPWGLGFELKGHKQPHWTSPQNSPSTFGHFGRSGTMLWIDPTARAGCVALTDQDFGPWSIEKWPVFSSAVLRESTAPPPT